MAISQLYSTCLWLYNHTLTHTHTVDIYTVDIHAYIISDNKYSSQHILEFYKQKLKSMPCQNQGFVLDGFPKTEEEAKELFARMCYMYMYVHVHVHTISLLYYIYVRVHVHTIHYCTILYLHIHVCTYYTLLYYIIFRHTCMYIL